MVSDIGDSAWSPDSDTYYQFLAADLGGRKQVHWLATQGRAKTSEYVTEYIVQYSDDGQQWITVTDSAGNAEVLETTTIFSSFTYLV